MTPPRKAELFLEALGTKTEFREALIGDLAEEFALRAERDGEVVARRWYYRETMRGTPHVLRDWLRRSTGRDFARLVGILVTTFLVMLVAWAFLAATEGVIAKDVFRIDPAYMRSVASWGIGARTLAVLTGLAVTMGVSALGGYFAAWLDLRSPLISAIALSVAWTAVYTAASAETASRSAPWPGSAIYRFSMPFLVLAASMVGGMLQAWSEDGHKGRGAVAPVVSRS